jgi:hypothetical protein
MEVDSTDDGVEDSQASSSTPAFSPEEHHKAAIDRRNSRTTSRSDGLSSTTSQHSPGSVSLPYSGSRPTMDAIGRGSRGSGSGTGSGTGSVSDAAHVLSQIPLDTRPYSKTPVPLTHDEAVLVHHYTEHLGRWLDCTDATRQFTLGVPRKVKLCPVLCYAVLSFAARHRKEEATAEAAYQKCIALLITRLNEDTASHDETLLCAIVILRFYEQLTGEHLFKFTRMYVHLTISSSLKYRLRRWKTSCRNLGHPASFPGPRTCRSIGAYPPRSCVLGLCPTVPIRVYYQPTATQHRLFITASPQA